MGFGRILDGEAAEQQLVGLGVCVRLLDRVGHIVGFGEEPRGAQDDRRQPGLQMISRRVLAASLVTP